MPHVDLLEERLSLHGHVLSVRARGGAVPSAKPAGRPARSCGKRLPAFRLACGRQHHGEAVLDTERLRIWQWEVVLSRMCRGEALSE
jgi:hypothetical protein